jgi:hypothetical protein
LAPILRPKIRTSDFVTGTKIATTWYSNYATAQDLHYAQYLQPHNIPHGANDNPPQKKSITLHHVAILVPHNELVMKSYVHVQLAIVATHHNLNNIKNREYWLLTSNVGIKTQKH